MFCHCYIQLECTQYYIVVVDLSSIGFCLVLTKALIFQENQSSIVFSDECWEFFKVKWKWRNVQVKEREIFEELFAEIFGYTLITLANKLINTTNKEKNQIIVHDIEKNKKKLYEEDDDYNCVI